MIPSKENLTICFAHAAYQMKDRFELRKTGIKNFEVRAYDELVSASARPTWCWPRACGRTISYRMPGN